jgi:hypothetical protein
MFAALSIIDGNFVLDYVFVEYVKVNYESREH